MSTQIATRPDPDEPFTTSTVTRFSLQRLRVVTHDVSEERFYMAILMG